jgi:multidrug efflux pump subunit AcrA (membrane-fusion protein)
MLKPDMFAAIKIGAAGKQPMVTLPASAVVVEGNDSVVFVADNSPGRFHRRTVHVGREVEGGVIVDSGVHPGEVVATRGALLLNELSRSKE